MVHRRHWHAAWVLVAALGATGCVEPEETVTTCGSPAVERPLLVLEVDVRGGTSSLGRLDRDGCLTEVAAGLALSGDTVLSTSRGRIFVLDRSSGLVHEIDAANLTLKRKFLAYAEGDSIHVNPWDVAVDDDGRLWIARYDRASLAIVGPDGSWQGEVDLSAFADEDGLPEMEAITIAGDRAYVALERLPEHGADLSALSPGLVVVLDTKTQAIEGTMDLIGANPFGPFVRDGSAPDGAVVTVTTPGSFGAIDERDGVERIDLAAGMTEVVATEQDLGGAAIDARIVGPNEAYAIVAGTAGANPTRVVAFDPATGLVTRTLAEAASFDHAGLAISGSLLVVGDGDRARSGAGPRLRLFDRPSGSEVGALPLHHAPAAAILPLD